MVDNLQRLCQSQNGTDGEMKMRKTVVAGIVGFGFKLGAWVSRQKTTKDTMSPERKQRLDDIGFTWAVTKGKT